MTTCEIVKEGTTWTVDCGIDGMDGYETHLEAQYAMAIKLWGGPLLTPQQAHREMPMDWKPMK